MSVKSILWTMSCPVFRRAKLYIISCAMEQRKTDLILFKWLKFRSHVGTWESEIFVRIELESNRRLRFEFESNLEPNQGIVVYMFNADCHVGVVYVLYLQQYSYT